MNKPTPVRLSNRETLSALAHGELLRFFGYQGCGKWRGNPQTLSTRSLLL
ncbi:MAG: hypothetical protein RMY34_15400 [Aulosira sp. DedQUE10]|nr:hypothetical protein [Aulosira sp. DedQUE10]